MSVSFVVKSAWRMYSSRMSAPDVFRFLRDQNETRTLVGALVIVDSEKNLALMANQSISRGSSFLSTGWSNDLLILPVGRWKMIAKSIGFPIVSISLHEGSTLPQVPRDDLKQGLAERIAQAAQ